MGGVAAQVLDRGMVWVELLHRCWIGGWCGWRCCTGGGQGDGVGGGAVQGVDRGMVWVELLHRRWIGGWCGWSCCTGTG